MQPACIYAGPRGGPVEGSRAAAAAALLCCVLVALFVRRYAAQRVPPSTAPRCELTRGRAASIYIHSFPLADPSRSICAPRATCPISTG